MNRFLRTRGQRKWTLITVLVLTLVTINLVALVIVARDFTMINMYDHRIERTPVEWLAGWLLFIECSVMLVLGACGLVWLFAEAVIKLIVKVNQWIDRGA